MASANQYAKVFSLGFVVLGFSFLKNLASESFDKAKVHDAIRTLRISFGEKLPLPHVIAQIAEGILCDSDQYTREERLEIAFNLMQAYAERGGLQIMFDFMWRISDLARGPHGETPLHYAAKCGRSCAARNLVQLGAMINDCCNQLGCHWTPLIWAAFKGYDQIVHVLIEGGAHLDFQDISGHTALMYAAWKGHINVVRELIDSGANPAIKNKNRTTAFQLAKTPEIKELLSLDLAA